MFNKGDIMKKLIYVCTIFCAFSLFTACEKDVDEVGDGTLSMKMRTWNNYEVPSKKSLQLKSSSDTILISFIEALNYTYEIKVTTDNIQEGMKDSDINWITIYESDEEKRTSERDFQFQLPPGDYKGFAVWQSNEFVWICDNNGTEILIPGSNSNEEVDRVYNVFGSEGMYSINEIGTYESVVNDERIGVSFTIEEGKNTTVTMRTNLDKIVWYDNDGSGNWTDGDVNGDFMLPDGIDTMMDFIVEYE